MKGFTLTAQAVKKTAALVRKDEQSGLPPAPPRVPITYQGDNGPFIGIAHESISPNSSGTFQFAYGTKGSEEADGTDVEGYYRTKNTPPAIASGDVLEVWWINDGWEIKPAGFAPLTDRVCFAQATITANSSGNFKFGVGTKGSESASGSNVSMYWRTTSGKSIPTNKKCLAEWVDDGNGHAGWEVVPEGCL